MSAGTVEVLDGGAHTTVQDVPVIVIIGLPSVDMSTVPSTR